ncbi:MAG: PaaI family thioesterase [Gordonia sp. (in: high G+C Gram-positive bacteria)]
MTGDLARTDPGSGRAPCTDPMTMFAVGDTVASAGRVTARQRLCACFTDHRGRIDLPALAVLFDHIGGIPFHDTVGGGSLQSRLMLSAIGNLAVDELLCGVAELEMHDGSVGATGVRITTGSGAVCCMGTARNVAVSRAADADPAAADGDGIGPIPECVGAHDVNLPDPIDEGDDGVAIVEKIAAGRRPAGPIADLLRARVEISRGSDGSDRRLRVVVDTAPWMGNMFGTMHGGVIATIVGQACSYAGQLGTTPGQDYRVGDLAVAFFRSPDVRGTEVVVEVEPVKIGRRIASVRARMLGPDAKLLAEGVSDIYFG